MEIAADYDRTPDFEIVIWANDLTLGDLGMMSAAFNSMLQRVAAQILDRPIRRANPFLTRAPFRRHTVAAWMLLELDSTIEIVVTELNAGSFHIKARIKRAGKKAAPVGTFTLSLIWSIEVHAPITINVNVPIGQQRPAEAKTVDIGPELTLLADTAILKGQAVRFKVRDLHTGSEIDFETQGGLPRTKK